MRITQSSEPCSLDLDPLDDAYPIRSAGLAYPVIDGLHGGRIYIHYLDSWKNLSNWHFDAWNKSKLQDSGQVDDDEKLIVNKNSIF